MASIKNFADTPVDGVWLWCAARASLATSPLRERHAIEMARAAAKLETQFQAASDDDLRARGIALKSVFRRIGLERSAIVEALALVRETCRRHIGLFPYEEQMAGGVALLRNAAIEMDTGEGKTLTSVFPSAIHAMAGRSVHIVTSNDYLAKRDGEFLKAALEALGLSVGIIIHDSDSDQRRRAYACDIVFVSNKEVAFDYLRDRLINGAGTGGDVSVATKTKKLLAPPGGASRSVMRGLDVAIVDEIDSVLIDDAGTPLMISTLTSGRSDEAIVEKASEIAAALRVGEHFAVDSHGISVDLTEAGRGQVDGRTAELGGMWGQRIRRYEVVRAAITAVHCLRRDKHYLVRDGKIVLIDEFSGRTMPDRYWGHDLHRMVEFKEGCPTSGDRKSLASISFQRFFRSYRDLAGMSGTIREVAVELSTVYGLSLTRIPRRKPLRRRFLDRQVYANREDTWDSAARMVKEYNDRGQPVLIGVRTVEEANLGSDALKRRGIVHAVLSAAHDEQEAEIVARAGQRGAVTIATNMAGRGTDIKLAQGIAELGGLVVMICERHDARRIDRQLMGRCARQGDPGVVVELLSREDAILRYTRPLFGLLTRLAATRPRIYGILASDAQRRIERESARRRIALVKRDEQMHRVLGFAGGLD
jgi:preprotein translocase subunit SecA